MSWIGYLAAALGGGLIGLLITLAALRRQPGSTSTALPDEAVLAEVAFAASTTGYAVLDSEGHVLVANARASELGVVRAGLVDHRIADAVGRARVAREPIDVELGHVEPIADLVGNRRPPSSVQAVVRATAEGYVVVSAADETEALRLEAVRRDFVANVSHELKTPVAAIGLLAEAVLDGYDEPEHVEKYGQKLLRESVRLGALVNELITLSRLQGADPLPELAVLEIDAVVDEAHSRSAVVAENAGMTILLDAPSGLLVKGDRQMLVTALVNLLANAVHYSPAGSTVSISRAVRGGFVEVAVTDRGIGIAPENQSRVFERFFRIDPARSRATGGTGLGLAIVKHVAANHGGAAVLWSKPGTGSTFTLRLPHYLPEATPAAQPPTTGPASAGAVLNGAQ
ncbi:two-component system, OmpR family, sensor histidine kinase SenX3 [Nakamurella panacisegetis]|uniref:Sensor-like histidine kinase SenX3 n=1 Tax=Nakamurella panacisegetis TaxID=1090615 RepID=A0A1H0JFM8_9ACTN|nr:ATP-binding protein [Nakamurella panacisegetis]SDO42444.1 two-component system, OmpR family, sensor histidine kinase SenX3 [Nakamurella panacisegetis]